MIVIFFIHCCEKRHNHAAWYHIPRCSFAYLPVRVIWDSWGLFHQRDVGPLFPCRSLMVPMSCSQMEVVACIVFVLVREMFQFTVKKNRPPNSMFPASHSKMFWQWQWILWRGFFLPSVSKTNNKLYLFLCWLTSDVFFVVFCKYNLI